MEQKENRNDVELEKLIKQVYVADTESSDFDPDTIELRQELKSFISKVEETARKDERERVIRECVEVVESFILPGGKGVATVDHANNCLQSVSLALKGLDNNK